MLPRSGSWNTIVRCLLLLLTSIVFVRSVRIEVGVFTNFSMPCNIASLPTVPESQKFVWFRDGRVNRAFNEIILFRGEIPFKNIGPDASGTYLCCYEGSPKVDCADVIQLYVKTPRPEIFRDTFLNITPVVFPNTIYWQPQMLTTPLEIELPSSEELVEFECFYFVKSVGSIRPNIRWYLNDRYPGDTRFEESIHDLDQRHKITVERMPCGEEYIRGEGGQCYKSTLTIHPLRDRKQRHALYACEVWTLEACGSGGNRLSVNYHLRTGGRSASDWTYGLADMKDFEVGCDGKLKGLQSLEGMVQELNGCERNTFLQLWVSPASGSDGIVQTTCSRPFYVVFNESLKLILLPADIKMVRMFADQNAAHNSLDGAAFYSALDKYGKVVLVSNRSKLHLRGEEYVLFEDFLRGNISLGCRSRQVLVVCAYGPLFRLELVNTACATPSDPTEGISIAFGVPCALVLIALLITGFGLYRGRRKGGLHQEVVWETVEEQTKSLMQSRLRSAPLPAPVESPESETEYLNLDEAQWPLCTSRLRLEERIARGSYGDVFKGTLSVPMVAEGKMKGTNKFQRQIVAKVLDDVFSKEHLLEFASEVAILRVIGAHPTIIQFLGCAQRTNLGNQPVLIIEFASQGSVQRYLRSLRPSPDTPLAEVVMTYWWTRARSLINDFFNFATDIANALVHLQKIGIAHCDISARNVLLTASLRAKLSDFGMACVIPQGEFIDLPSAKRIPVRWSALEIIKWNCRHSRSDVWSFGVLLWEIFSLCETPYRHLDSEDAVVHYVSVEGGRLSRPPLLIHDGLYDLMVRCWAASVDQRPDYETLLEGLQSAAVGRDDSKDVMAESSDHIASYLPMET